MRSNYRWEHNSFHIGGMSFAGPWARGKISIPTIGKSESMMPSGKKEELIPVNLIDWSYKDLYFLFIWRRVRLVLWQSEFFTFQWIDDLPTLFPYNLWRGNRTKNFDVDNYLTWEMLLWTGMNLSTQFALVEIGGFQKDYGRCIWFLTGADAHQMSFHHLHGIILKVIRDGC